MNDGEKPSDIDRRIAMDARDWIVRLTSGEVGAADIERFKAWRDRSPDHRRAFERERAFWQQLQALDGRSAGPLPVPPPARASALGRRPFLVGTAVAATTAVAVLAAPRVGVWWKASYSTVVGDQGEYTLPDGSVAALNTDSAIAVDFRSDLRLVELLKGEAEFRVRPDASALFRVAALGGNSDSFGTTVSVRAVDGLATVTALEGHVRVTAPAAPSDPGDGGDRPVDLVANQQTRYGRGQRPAAPVMIDAGTVMAWRTGRIIIEGQPFGRAIAEIGRYVPERVVMGPGVNADVPVSGVFKTKDALPAMTALAKTQGLTIRRIPGVVLLIT